MSMKVNALPQDPQSNGQEGGSQGTNRKASRRWLGSWTTRRFSPSTGRLPDRVIDEDQKAPDVARSGPGAQPSKCLTLSMRPRDALNRRH